MLLLYRAMVTVGAEDVPTLSNASRPSNEFAERWGRTARKAFLNFWVMPCTQRKRMGERAVVIASSSRALLILLFSCVVSETHCEGLGISPRNQAWC